VRCRGDVRASARDVCRACRAGPEDTRRAWRVASVAASIHSVEQRAGETRPPEEGALQEAIGRQIREFRTALGMTVADLGRQSELSAGAISKIERGLTPPSLASLSAIAGALAVPVTALFRKHEDQRDASYVPAGKGLVIERRGTRAGHRYELLGHTVRGPVAIEPYLVTLTEESEVFPLFQHAGVEFLYLLEGEVVYRAAGTTYHLHPGDSLLFDGDVAHGPEKLIRLPIRMLAVISRATDGR
jgi:transcriptional regulator with XRE-family HTH domain